MKIYKFLTLLLILFFNGCSTSGLEATRKMDSTATEIPSPTDKGVLPTEEVQPSPNAASLSTPDTTSQPIVTLVAATATPGHQRVFIFLIALEDNGQSGQFVGCGDSVIPVKINTTPSLEVLRMSMEALLSMNEQYFGESGLYNSLYQSDLSLESISLENGKAVIHLTGSLILGGVCDNPRVEAQLEATALQFNTVNEVTIFINGKPLKEILSLQG